VPEVARERQTGINAILGGYDPGMAPLLQLAVDGSWGPETPRVYSCGGIVAASENWGVISRHWNLALDSEGLTCLRMAEAINLRGQFSRGWDSHRRAVLFEKLIRAIESSGVALFSAAADTRRLQGHSSIAAKKKSLFQDAIATVLHGNDHHVVIMCDREHDFAGDCLKWVRNLEQRPNAIRRVWGICYMDCSLVPPVQAAELWVYLHREEMERSICAPDAPVSKWFTRMVKGRNLRTEPSQFTPDEYISYSDRLR
jgi:hypothetical protein